MKSNEGALQRSPVVALSEAKRMTDGLLLDVTHHSATASDSEWGWLPGLSFVSALGLPLTACADTAARGGAAWAEPHFWFALLVLFAPTAMRLAAVQTTRRERIRLVALLGLGLYLVKVLNSPTAFTLHDELGHWRATDDIMQTGHLFRANPLDRIYPLYPGVEIVTTALTHLGGWTLFGAGVIVLAVARMVLVTTIFLFFETVSKLARVAGTAALLYMTNPNFVFFDAQYAYELLALPLAALGLLMVMYRERSDTDMGRAVSRWLLPLVIGAVTLRPYPET